MCGLFGYVNVAAAREDPALFDAMLAHVRRRGPDGEGGIVASRVDRIVTHLFTERSPPGARARGRGLEEGARKPHDCAVLHCRYAVIDRSEAAHQPWTTDDGRVTVAFQGEIFNFPELRHELEREGVRFRTSGDTEVLANALRSWGDEAWCRFNGFWAVVAFDRERGEVVLCRDRLGIAPLYVSRNPERSWFSSSALGIARLRGDRPEIDVDRVRDFVECGLRDYDGATLFEGVRAFPPGRVARIGPGGLLPGDDALPRYWTPPGVSLRGSDLSLDEAADRLRDVMSSAVEIRLRGDLSIAYQLSGGLDSTTVVALAAEQSGSPLPTYTVSVPESDEDPLAATMTELHALDRHVLRGREDALVDEFRSFTALMEEPVQAPAAWANHDLCRVAHGEGHGVMLSGSGGDEVLAGYEWDFWPAARAHMLARGLRLDVLRYDAVLRYGTPTRFLQSSRAWLRWGARLPARMLGRSTAGAMRHSLGEPDRSEGPRAGELMTRYASLDYDACRLFHISRAHLPYYLASNDRATLGIPVEHRQPFLDHRAVELGLSLPPEYLFRDGWTKYVLRRAMSGRVPDAILWRREKVGFPFPLQQWLGRHESTLRPFAERSRALVGEARHINAPPGEEPGRLWRRCAVGAWLELLADGS